MTTMGLLRSCAAAAAIGMLGGGAALAAPLTADDAVKIALKNNSQVIGAEAGVLGARGSLYGSYSSLLPRVSAAYSRSVFKSDNQSGGRNIGGGLTAPITSDFEQYSTSRGFDGSWSPLNLSSITGLMAARAGLKAAQLSRVAARSEVALVTRRQFYEVVKAIKLAEVAEGALKLARDDERRVNAMFEVGSVSKSDLLKARVRSAQSELSRLQANHAVNLQRIALAEVVGIPESQLGEVDTVLVVAERTTYDEAQVLAEAGRNWPDLKAAEAQYRAARGSLRSARLSRFPSLTASGSMDIDPFTSSASTINPPGAPPVVNPGTTSTRTTTHRNWSGSLALSWNIFDGLGTESRVATAKAGMLRARDNYEALKRNLASEVRRALLAYREADESDAVAKRGLESAQENFKLTQEKYNVGSATILELIDAQVQLETAQSDAVRALAALRVAEAQINRVRGQSE